MTPLACPKATCAAAAWTATGVFSYSHRGVLRAQLRCDRCGYLFNSGRPEAIEAGKAAGGVVPERGPAPDVDAPKIVARLKAAASMLPMESARSVGMRVPQVRDFKLAQGGDE